MFGTVPALKGRHERYAMLTTLTTTFPAPSGFHTETALPMFERLDNLLKRREEIDTLLASPEVVADPEQLTRLGRERATLLPVVSAWERLQAAEDELADARGLASDPDPEVAALAEEEADTLSTEVERLNQELREALLPKDPNDNKNVIMEIRGGTGGR